MFKNHFHIVIYSVYFNDIILQFKKSLFQLFNIYSVMMTQVYTWTLTPDFSSTFQNITLYTSCNLFDTITNVSFYLFKCKFYCLFQCGFYHFPSQTALPSPAFYGYLDSGTSDIHTGGHATGSYASLSMGNWLRETPSAAYPNHAQSVPSTTGPWRPSTDSCQCQPPYPPPTISLKSKLIKSLELIWEKVWENQGKFYT